MKHAIELISIGTELLSGRTLNTHAQTLGTVLSAMGLQLSRDTTIPDVKETIQSAVNNAFDRVDIVIVSGGLGPTVDDITRESLATLFGVNVVLSQSALKAVQDRYASRGYPFTPAAERQALILEGAETLLNSAGCAPGERLALPDGKTLFIIPGPPAEFAAILNEHVVPWLRNTFPDAISDELCVLTTQGIGESAIVSRLDTAGFQCSDISIGFYPGSGKVEIRLSAPKEKIMALEAAECTLRELLHDYLIV